MEWAIEKCTELGVSRIVPVIARRTDAHLAASRRQTRRTLASNRPPSRRAIPPRQSARNRRAHQTARCRRPAFRPAHCPRGIRTANPAQRLLASHEQGEIALAIGPEGGWTEEELNFFRNPGGPPLPWAPRFCAPKPPPSPPPQSQFLSSQPKKCQFAFRPSC